MEKLVEHDSISIVLSPTQILRVMRGAELLRRKIRANKKLLRKYTSGGIPSHLNITHR